MLPLFAYNLVAFGTVWKLGYQGVVGFEGMNQGLFGLGWPRPVVLWEIIFGTMRGLVWVAPVLLLAPQLSASLLIFTGQGATDDIAWVVRMLTLGLVPYGMYLLSQRVFHAYQEGKPPFRLQLVITGIQGQANVTRTRKGVTSSSDGTKFLTATANGTEYSFPELDGLSIPGLVEIETGVVEKLKSGIEVTAVRLTLLDGSGAVIDLGHAKLLIAGTGLK